MNNTVAIISPKRRFQRKRVNKSLKKMLTESCVVHVFIAVPCCFKRYFARWIFDLGG